MGEENRKRKREAGEPRIKYHVEQCGKSFERILKENSREELCEVVRKKLNLSSKTSLELAQIREGVVYDLEDDEDFEAFKSAAYAYSSLDVRVSYSVDAISQNTPNARAGPSSASEASTNPRQDHQKEGGRKLTSIEGQTTREHSLITGASVNVDGDQSVDLTRSNRVVSSAKEETAAPPKKRRKKDLIDLDTTATERSKRKKAKVNEADVHTPNSAVVADQTPLRKKRKKRNELELETSGSPMDETHSSTADTPEVNIKSKKTRSKKPPAGSTDMTEDVPAKELRVKKGKSTKKISSVTTTPVTSTSGSVPAPIVTHPESPSPFSAPLHPQADPGLLNPKFIRHTYATLLRKLPSTVAPVYSSGTVSQDNPRKSASVVDDAVTPTSSTVETRKSRKVATVDVVDDNVKNKPKPKLAKSRLSEGWTPLDTEEAPSSPSPSNKPPSVSHSSDVVDAATLPQPLTLSPPVTRIISSPRREGTKPSPANIKLASVCPICLSSPFHLRFKCPVIAAGPDSIVERIAQLKAEGGKEGLIDGLEEWLQKTRKKPISKEAASKETETHSKLRSPVAAQSKQQDSPLPPWAPVLSLQTNPSEVIMENTNEGSESATSSGSERGDKSNSSTESSSGSGSMLTGVDLEHVDLDSLIRGPAFKVSPMKLLGVADENDDEEEAEKNPEDDDDDDDVGDVDLLEEEDEDENPLPKRFRGSNLLRSKSPETVDGDEDDRSESDVEQEGPAAEMNGLRSESTHPDQSVELERPSLWRAAGENEMGYEIQVDKSMETDLSAQESIDEDGMELDHGTIAADNVDTEVLANGDAASHPNPADSHASVGSLTSEDPSASSNVEREAAAGMASTYSSTHPDQSLELESSVPDATNGKKTQQDYGTSPHDKVDTELSATTDTASHPKPDDFHTTPGPSIAAAIPASQPVVKRRGRPSLPDSVKAERQALKDAQEAEEAAEKRAKSEQTRKTPSASCPPPSKKPDKSVASSFSSTRTPLFLPGASQMSQSQFVPRFVELASEETTQDAQEEREDSASGSSSDEGPPKSESLKRQPSIQDATDGKSMEQDQGMTTPDKVDTGLLATIDIASRPKPGDSHTTPGPSIACAVPASQPVVKRRGRPPLPDSVKAERRALKDAQKAEKAAEKAAEKRAKSEQKRKTPIASRPPPSKKPDKSVASSSSSSTRTPLFLPGASQMSQSQIVPRFVALASEETTQDAQEERGDSPSMSSSGEGPPKSAIPRAPPASQSAFPSLSQLSFDKFKPSFLLTNPFSRGTNNVKQSGTLPVDEESSEEDESSESEQESRIPKDKRAGAGIVKRLKSRGLLH